MNQQEYKEMQDKSLKISIKDYEAGNLTSEQLGAMTLEEKADYIVEKMANNLNANVMRQDKEDREKLNKDKLNLDKLNQDNLNLDEV